MLIVSATLIYANQYLPLQVVAIKKKTTTKQQSYLWNKKLLNANKAVRTMF